MDPEKELAICKTNITFLIHHKYMNDFMDNKNADGNYYEVNSWNGHTKEIATKQQENLQRIDKLHIMCTKQTIFYNWFPLSGMHAYFRQMFEPNDHLVPHFL